MPRDIRSSHLQTATATQGPNPLWAINIGMAAFLITAALIVVMG